MSVKYIGGVPGSGKTLFCTYLAKKKYKKENRFKRHKINNVFTNYPVQLTNKFGRKKYKTRTIKENNKKVKQKIDTNVYSRKVSLEDFKLYKRHIPDSLYIFDEFDSYFDSLDYKKFPDKVRINFKFHRHFGIKDIYVITQHPSRLVKQARVLCDEYYRIKKFIKIPFLGICLFKYDVYYNSDDYGSSTKVRPEEVKYEFRHGFKIFRYRRVFNCYDTKYMNKLVENEQYFESNMYDNLSLSIEDIENNFNIKK